MAEHTKPQKQQVGMPPRVFLYTLDQIAYLASLTETAVKTKYVHYEGRSLGSRPAGKLLARCLNPGENRPDWRVAEEEVVRWLRQLGFRVRTYRERAWVSD